jgi:hypothetical protein
MSNEHDADLQAAMNAMKSRIVERHEAIEKDHTQNEQLADQQIVNELRSAASACPPQSPGPEAKQNFEKIATQYEQSPNRDDRDRLLYEIVPVVLKNHSGILQLLGAVACISITFIAPKATMIGEDGESTDGYSIDNDPSDGVHKFMYDTNGDRIPDHEAWVKDDTNEQIGEATDIGAWESICTLFESVFG